MYSRLSKCTQRFFPISAFLRTLVATVPLFVFRLHSNEVRTKMLPIASGSNYRGSFGECTVSRTHFECASSAPIEAALIDLCKLFPFRFESVEGHQLAGHALFLHKFLYPLRLR